MNGFDKKMKDDGDGGFFNWLEKEIVMRSHRKEVERAGRPASYQCEVPRGVLIPQIRRVEL